MDFSIIEAIGILAGIISFIAFLFYYRSILRGETIPNRATWFILTIVGLLISSSYYSVGARETIWVTVSYVIGPLIVFILSIKYGEGGWGLFDRVCLILSAVSVAIWFISGSALLSLLINISIDLFGILPTVKKVYLKPHTEALLPWTITSIASLLNLIAIDDWIFSIYIYPVYMIIFNALITLLIVIPFLKNRSKT